MTLLARVALNAAALWIAQKYITGFMLSGDLQSLAAGAAVLTILNVFLAPLLRLITTPLRWLTLGLFNIVINMAILYLADLLLPQLAISGLVPLFWTSLVVGVANAFF